MAGLTWLAAAGDTAQQLTDSVVGPGVQDSGQNVEICCRKAVFEEVTWCDDKMHYIHQGHKNWSTLREGGCATLQNGRNREVLLMLWGTMSPQYSSPPST